MCWAQPSAVQKRQNRSRRRLRGRFVWTQVNYTWGPHHRTGRGTFEGLDQNYNAEVAACLLSITAASHAHLPHGVVIVTVILSCNGDAAFRQIASACVAHISWADCTLTNSWDGWNRMSGTLTKYNSSSSIMIDSCPLHVCIIIGLRFANSTAIDSPNSLLLGYCPLAQFQSTRWFTTCD